MFGFSLIRWRPISRYNYFKHGMHVLIKCDNRICEAWEAHKDDGGWIPSSNSEQYGTREDCLYPTKFAELPKLGVAND